MSREKSEKDRFGESITSTQGQMIFGKQANLNAIICYFKVPYSLIYEYFHKGNFLESGLMGVDCDL